MKNIFYTCSMILCLLVVLCGCKSEKISLSDVNDIDASPARAEMFQRLEKEDKDIKQQSLKQGADVTITGRLVVEDNSSFSGGLNEKRVFLIGNRRLVPSKSVSAKELMLLVGKSLAVRCEYLKGGDWMPDLDADNDNHQIVPGHEVPESTVDMPAAVPSLEGAPDILSEPDTFRVISLQVIN